MSNAEVEAAIWKLVEPVLEKVIADYGEALAALAAADLPSVASLRRKARRTT